MVEQMAPSLNLILCVIKRLSTFKHLNFQTFTSLRYTNNRYLYGLN